MHWITIIGIIMIGIGTFLTFVGQNRSNKSDVASLQKSIGEKNTRIDELVIGNSELIAKIDKYQKTLNEKDKEIENLEAKIGKLSLTAPKLLPDGRIAASPGVSYTSDFSDAANRARELFNQARYDEAYKVADDLRRKNPEFGLAYFLLGTIEAQKGNLAKSSELIERSIQLELTDGDKAWAFHNLGIVALRQKKIKRAIEYLKKAIQVNPNMEESKITLKSIEDQVVVK